MPILLNRRAVGALGVDLKFKADRNYDRSVQFYGIVASTIAQAVKIQRLIEEDKKKLLDENTQLRQELKERVRLLRASSGRSGPVASDVRADVAGGGRPTPPCSSEANRAPARSWSRTPSTTTRCAPTSRSSR